MGARLILHPFDVLLNFLRVGLMLCNVGIYRFYHPKPTKTPSERTASAATICFSDVDFSAHHDLIISLSSLLSIHH